MTGRSALPGCGPRRCLVSICRRSFTALFSAFSPTLFFISAARLPAGRPRSSACKPMSSFHRRWRRWRRASGCGAASVTTEELIATIARYLGEERTRELFASFAASRRVSLAPQAEADFQLLQYGEYLLASAIGAASSRLVLSLLLRKRTVSTKAALKLLDDANAAIHYNREILQTALDHVRQGIAVFDKDSGAGLLEPAVRRNLRPAAFAHPHRYRARGDPSPYRQARVRAMCGTSTIRSRNGSPSTRRKPSRFSSALPSAGW